MKHILTALLFLLHVASHAQVEKGRFTFGADLLSFGFSTQQLGVSETKTTSYALAPGIGFFSAKNLRIGISPSFAGSKGKTTNNGSGPDYTTDQKSYSIGPVIEYYLGDSNSGRPFIGLQVALGSGSVKYSVDFGGAGNPDSEYKAYSIKPVMGYAIFLNDSFMLRVLAGYSHEWRTETQSGYDFDYKTSEFFIGVSILSSFKRKKDLSVVQ